ncbi:MAG: amylo-alpha-1,6-glucosidase [Gemmatimonadales bacterium]
MEEIIQVESQYYIRATSERVAHRARVLKQGEAFALFDRRGDIQPIGLGEQGVFYQGTRFISRLELLLDDRRPLLLSSTVNEDNALLAVDLTNPDIVRNGDVLVPTGTLHVFRATFLWQGCCYERIRITNHGLLPAEARLALRFDGDFVDIFEVRGARRERRGERHAQVREREAWLVYDGLDGVTRRARIIPDPEPTLLAANELQYAMALPPQGSETINIAMVFEVGDEDGRPVESHDEALRAASTALARARSRDCRVTTSNEQLNDWINRSAADLHMMVSETPHGSYPYAGVPWFSTPFGRDGIVTALEYLWINPDLARGVLRFLAATQADREVPERDAEPGKILHEARGGEMAALEEIPFGRYYGGCDSTPLFVILAGAYYERTADAETAEVLWPSVERALSWMRSYGDPDGDGLLEYHRRSPTGLINQGWKDSDDSVFHADGRLAEPPIALCEVQGYAYAALRAGAMLAEALGLHGRAVDLERDAEWLRQRIEEAFWLEELGTYALALDGEKQPCRVLASNAGHLLFCGVPSLERGDRVARLLLGERFFSGWGIRTVASSESRYNPISYHNGSVWPHDNALIAMGLSRYGAKPATLAVLMGLFGASLFVELHRMPELFCGFGRRHGQGPTAYPVACAPQSWAAASVFSLLQSCLGLGIHAARREVRFVNPALPESIEEVRIDNLRCGDTSLDLQLFREGDDVGVTIARRDGPASVLVVK